MKTLQQLRDLERLERYCCLQTDSVDKLSSTHFILKGISLLSNWTASQRHCGFASFTRGGARKSQSTRLRVISSWWRHSTNQSATLTNTEIRMGIDQEAYCCWVLASGHPPCAPECVGPKVCGRAGGFLHAPAVLKMRTYSPGFLEEVEGVDDVTKFTSTTLYAVMHKAMLSAALPGMVPRQAPGILSSILGALE